MYCVGRFALLQADDRYSVRFYPDSPTAFADAGLAVKVNAAGGAQLRMDAIDALETHYTPRSAPHAWHRPAGLGNGAATALLDLLGFTDVQRDPCVRRRRRTQAVGQLPVAGRRRAYPTFYSKLFVDLRNALAEVAVDARNAGKGVWEHDARLTGFRLSSSPTSW